MGTVSKLKSPVKNEIQTFLHCKKCIEELPGDQSPQEFIWVEVGWTVEGIQVWCLRHELNIVHMDFEGHKHPAK